MRRGIPMNNQTIKEILKYDSIGEECTKITHKSGLEIYVVKKDYATSYALFGTKYGSYDNGFMLETDKDFTRVPLGIAHFLEHKMFEDESGIDSFELYARTGADANAFTSTNMTAYIFSSTSEFNESLKILLKMVTSPFFTSENVKKEQGIIAEEIKMCEDRPGDALYYGLNKALYKDNPIRFPIAGTVDSIMQITPELLYKCYDVFYQMSNMVLCISGDVNVDEILKIADEILPVKETKNIIRENLPEQEEVYKYRHTEHMEVSKPLFKIGVKHIANEGENSMLGSLFCETFFSTSGKFYNELIEKNLITSYNSYFEHSNVADYLSVSGTADDPNEIFMHFENFANSILETGIDEQSFFRAKRVLYAETIKTFESSSNIAESIFYFLVNGDDFMSSAEELDKITKEDLWNFTKKLLTPSHFAMSTVYPKTSTGGEK